MKEQIGILVTIIPGDSPSKEMACLEVLVTHVPMDVLSTDLGLAQRLGHIVYTEAFA